MDRFVNSQTSHAKSPRGSPRGTNKGRLEMAKGLMIKIDRQPEANSAIQRQGQKQGRSEMPQNVKEGPHNAFDGSVLGDSTVTSLRSVPIYDFDTNGETHARHEDDVQMHEQHSKDQYEDVYQVHSAGDDDEQAQESIQSFPDNHAGAVRNVATYLNVLATQGHIAGQSVGDVPQKGDSYPATTSGAPSIRGDLHDEDPQFIFQPNYANSPGQLKHSKPSHPKSAAPIQKDMSQHQSQYQPPAPQHSNLTHRLQSHSVNTTAGATTARDIRQSAKVIRSAPHTYPPTMQPVVQVQHPQAASYTHDETPYQQQIPPLDQIPYSQQLRSQLSGSLNPRSTATTIKTSPTPQYELPPVSLLKTMIDYKLEELLKADYKQLHQQSLGNGVSENPTFLTKDNASKPLPEQLHIVQEMSADEKRTFIASLTIEQWEEAGDWFLDRFGDILSKVKEARKERRRLAQGFADQIFQRHEEVQTKKRDIEEALKSMGESGTKVVLAGTPQKKKARV